MAADWSNGPQGPGWFVKFPTNVPALLTSGGGGGSGSVISVLPMFDPPRPRRIEFDEDEVIALSLLEL